MRTRFSIVAGVAALISMATPVGAAVPSADILSRMFHWWDGAFKQKDGFTPDAFRQYFTEDATLTLEGKTVIHGVPEWVAHFRKIQASGREVEIVVPFKRVFQAGDHIYTYHIIRSRGGGQIGCVIAAGDAVLKNGKIASITLVRHDLDQETRAAEPDCWRQ